MGVIKDIVNEVDYEMLGGKDTVNTLKAAGNVADLKLGRIF